MCFILANCIISAVWLHGRSILLLSCSVLQSDGRKRMEAINPGGWSSLRYLLDPVFWTESDSLIATPSASPRLTSLVFGSLSVQLGSLLFSALTLKPTSRSLNEGRWRSEQGHTQLWAALLSPPTVNFAHGKKGGREAQWEWYLQSAHSYLNLSRTHKSWT